jgi:uncharacterized damage-inducible protein DinB
MSTIATLIGALPFVRSKTFDLISRIEKLPDPMAALAWRPGPGRAHIGWQLMHIAITEEIFATERFLPEKERSYEDIWPRFRGGSTPDDVVPELPAIRMTLETTRLHLLETLHRFSDADLGNIPAGLTQRGLTLQQSLELIAWHEGHHHGQAHLTLNLFKASHGID